MSETKFFLGMRTANLNGYILQIRVLDNGKFYILLYDDTNDTSVLQIHGPTLNINTWYYFVVSFSGSGFKFYMDGIDITSIASTYVIGSSTMDLTISKKYQDFREEVRAFLAESLTPEIREAGRYSTCVFSDSDSA